MTAPVETDAASDWRATSATRRGSAHSGHAPNQDAVRCETVHDTDGVALWVGAVSDGHGGRRYVRSDVGARAAVDIAVDQLTLALAARSGAQVDAVLRECMPTVVARWRALVDDHRAQHPFTDEERDRAGVDHLDDHVAVAYGATLVVAVVGDAGVALAQIGDGDALVRVNGFALRPVPGDDRLVAGETTSLCLDTAPADFRFASVPGTSDVDLVLLASDGYGNSFASADWWHELVDDLAWFVDHHGFEEFESQFPGWLQESAEVGGDDVSAVLAVRTPLVVASTARAVTGAEQPPTPPPAPPSAPPPRPEPPAPVVLDHGGTLPMPVPDAPVAPASYDDPRRGRRAVVLASALVGVLLAVGAVALLGRDGSGTDPSGPGTPAGTPTPSSTPSTPVGSPTGPDTSPEPGSKDGKGTKKGTKKGADKGADKPTDKGTKKGDGPQTPDGSPSTPGTDQPVEQVPRPASAPPQTSRRSSVHQHTTESR